MSTSSLRRTYNTWRDTWKAWVQIQTPSVQAHIKIMKVILFILLTAVIIVTLPVGLSLFMSVVCGLGGVYLFIHGMVASDIEWEQKDLFK